MHHDLYGRRVAMCSWCSLTVRWPGSRMFLTCALPVVESRLLVLHCPHRPSYRSTELNFIQIAFSHPAHRRTLVVFHSAHQIAVLRFQFAWTCLPRSLLLPSQSWVVAVLRGSLPLLSSDCNLIDCIDLHGGLYLMGATAPDGTFTNKSSTYTLPSFLSTDFSFFFHPDTVRSVCHFHNSVASKKKSRHYSY